MKKFEKCLCCKKSDVKTDISAEKKDKTLNTKETNVKAHMRTRKNKYHVLSAHGNQVFSEKPLSKHHKKNIFKKQVDYRQEPAKPDRKVNVNNSYGEKEVKVDYRILEERMETGDILLFNIKNFVNVIEKVVTKTKYAHVGMIVQESDLTDQSKERFFVRPAVSPRIFVLHMVKEGMRLNRITDLLGVKGNTVCYRHLQVDRTEEMLRGLNDFIFKFSNVPYEKSLIEMFKSAYDYYGGRNENETLDMLFCSEMMAKVYQDMGLLKPSSQGGLVCNEYAPRDFTSKVELDLLRAATLEDEVEILCRGN